MKKIFNFKTLLSLSLAFIPTVMFAGGYYTTTTPADQQVSAPLDGGLSLLLAAGVGYGAKKYAQLKKKNQSMEK